jgi:small nuclear ribonucleoprotein (snRNP)-like protein
MLILLQSCYSYQPFNIQRYEALKPKKVKIEMKNSKRYDGKIIAYTDDKVVLRNFNTTREISIPEIETIKGRKFSILKTYLFGAAISIATLIFLFYQLLEGIGEVSISGAK